MNLRFLDHQKTLCSNQYSFWKENWAWIMLAMIVHLDNKDITDTSYLSFYWHFQSCPKWLASSCKRMTLTFLPCSSRAMYSDSTDSFQHGIEERRQRELRVQRFSDSLLRIQDLKYLFLLHLRKKNHSPWPLFLCMDILEYGLLIENLFYPQKSNKRYWKLPYLVIFNISSLSMLSNI